MGRLHRHRRRGSNCTKPSAASPGKTSPCVLTGNGSGLSSSAPASPWPTWARWCATSKGNPPHPPQRRRPQTIQPPPIGPLRGGPQHQPSSAQPRTQGSGPTRADLLSGRSRTRSATRLASTSRPQEKALPGTNLKTASASRCSRLNSLPDYLDNLCPLLPNYHDHTLPDYREAEQYWPFSSTRNRVTVHSLEAPEAGNN